MIDAALNNLAEQLNQHLRNTFSINEDLAVVSNLVGLDGTVAPQINNKIVLCLANVGEDAVTHQAPARPGDSGDRRVRPSSLLNLSLHLVIAAHFTGTNYPEALRFLSSTIGFFQRQPVFDRNNTPSLDNRIKRLLLTVENPGFEELSCLWSTVGGNYIPSVLYQVRIIENDSGEVIE